MVNFFISSNKSNDFFYKSMYIMIFGKHLQFSATNKRTNSLTTQNEIKRAVDVSRKSIEKQENIFHLLSVFLSFCYSLVLLNLSTFHNSFPFPLIIFWTISFSTIKQLFLFAQIHSFSSCFFL